MQSSSVKDRVSKLKKKAERPGGNSSSRRDAFYMELALRLARRAYGRTSPNPMVGAVLVKGGKVIGQGWHHRAGEPHAEIEAIRDAQRRKQNPRGATLYITLEPCSTHGRTPPCVDAIIAAEIKRVVVAATDPNPAHAGKGFGILQKAGIEVVHGIESEKAGQLNEAFNHWIVHRTPFVTVKAAMTLDGKIATAAGESKWITGEKARGYGMKLREGSDAILVGVNTVLLDDPSLTFRAGQSPKLLRRIILDPEARTPILSKVVDDTTAALTTIVVTRKAPANRVAALAKKVNVWIAPARNGKINLSWFMKKLGAENVTSLLVEGGGETNAQFFEQGLAHRVVFFYAPKILCGRDSRKAVAGDGLVSLKKPILLHNVEWSRVGGDLLLSGRA